MQVTVGLAGPLFVIRMFSVRMLLTTVHSRQPLVYKCRVVDRPKTLRGQHRG